MKSENRAKLLIVISMFIWGTIGIFRRYIPLSSGIIAFTRGLIGTVFLVLTMVITRKKISFAEATRVVVYPMTREEIERYVILSWICSIV